VEIANAHNLSLMFQQVSDDQVVSEIATGLFAEPAAPAAPIESTVTEADSESGTERQSAGASWISFVAAALIFLIAVGGMAIGTMLQNKSIKGSCGGLASLPGSDGKSACELCTAPKSECQNAELRAQMQAAAERTDDDA
jgi:hypothetical protein